MKRCAVLACSGLLFFGAAAADDGVAEPVSPYNALLGHYLHTDSQRDGSSGFGATSVVGFSIARGLNLELSGTGTVIGRDSDNGTDGLIGIGADLQLPFGNGPVRPFVLAGGGGDYERLGTAADRKTFALFVDAGAGLLVRLTPRIDLRAEARGVYTFNDSGYPDGNPLLDVRVGLGVQARLFGVRARPRDGDSDGDGIRDSLDRCPGTPPGVAVDAYGCPAYRGASVPALDTDLDGVPDSRDQCPGTPLGVQVDAKGCPVVLDSDGDGVLDTLDQCPGTPAGFKVDARGCIVEQIAILRSVNFEFGSDKLTTEARGVLDQLAKSLEAQPSLTLEVSGHTDSLGPQAINLALSQKRAAAVKTYLVAHGTAANRLHTEGYGEFNPIATNETEAGRAQNRRVEFKVLNRAVAAPR